jgi:hypothetical protein
MKQREGIDKLKHKGRGGEKRLKKKEKRGEKGKKKSSPKHGAWSTIEKEGRAESNTHHIARHKAR